METFWGLGPIRYFRSTLKIFINISLDEIENDDNIDQTNNQEPKEPGEFFSR